MARQDAATAPSDQEYQKATIGRRLVMAQAMHDAFGDLGVNLYDADTNFGFWLPIPLCYDTILAVLASNLAHRGVRRQPRTFESVVSKQECE